jgi:alkylation response protein AidB-like acyl-CoA dehydrogenase
MSQIDPAELELFRDNVKRFLDKEIAPHYEKWEKESWMPRDIWNKLGENGLLSVDQDEQYGGAGRALPVQRGDSGRNCQGRTDLALHRHFRAL